MMHIRQLKFLVPCGVGVVLLTAGCSRNVTSVDVAEMPPTSATTPASKPASSKAIAWQPSLDAALAKAKSQGKPVMIDFYATWCGPCKILDEQIYPDANVAKEAKNFISVKLNVDMQSEAVNQYRVGGLPTVLFLDASGKEVHRLVGLFDVEGEADQFAKLLRKVYNGLNTRNS